MGGRELDQHILVVDKSDPEEQERIIRRAAVHAADRVAAAHPHELDALMPRLAGRLTAQDPAVRAEVLELLDAIGYRKEQQ